MSDLRSLTLAFERAREDVRICEEFDFPVPVSFVFRRQATEELLEQAMLAVVPAEKGA